MSDYTRKFDLEELAEAIKNARSTGEREFYERVAFRIINESTEVGVLRNDLARAVRSNDHRAVKMIQRRIQERRREETGGYSWGANKQNRNVN